MVDKSVDIQERLKTQRVNSTKLGALPVVRYPMRKIRPATQMATTVARITKAAPRRGSHSGKLGAATSLHSMMVGVASGMNDKVRAKAPVGSSITGSKNIRGRERDSVTGISKLWACFMSEQALPTAINREP